MHIYLTTFLTPTLLFLYFLEICWNKVYRQYMPIFSEIAPRTFKISRFESKNSENENHKFTIFQTNQYGKTKKNKRSYPFDYITFHFKTNT